jgi:hypothetical protein
MVIKLSSSGIKGGGYRFTESDKIYLRQYVCFGCEHLIYCRECKRFECAFDRSVDKCTLRKGKCELRNVHVFSKNDLIFLRSCASACLGCEFLCWCDVHKFYCVLGLPLTTVSCSRCRV